MFKFSVRQKFLFVSSLVCFLAFLVLTWLVVTVNVDSQVGLAQLNQFFWQRLGRQQVWELVTDVLGYLLILIVVGLVFWQVYQWFSRKSLFCVDKNLLFLDIVLICVFVFYVFFEIFVVNYRPEIGTVSTKASYPSSHVMFFATVLPILMWLIWHYIKHRPTCLVLTILLSFTLLVGTVGRLLSGVHWFTDVLASLIISACLDCFYFIFV